MYVFEFVLLFIIFIYTSVRENRNWTERGHHLCPEEEVDTHMPESVEINKHTPAYSAAPDKPWALDVNHECVIHYYWQK